MKKIIVLSLISFIFLSCNKEAKNIQQAKDLNKVSCELPEINIFTEEINNNIFFNELLVDKNIKKTALKQSHLFHKNEECMAKRLYFGKNFPSEAVEYKNEGPYLLYDFKYPSIEETQIAYENLMTELDRQSKKIDNVQFDYFKGSSHLFFLDEKAMKISITICSAIQDIKNHKGLISFAKKNKNKFDKILLGSPTGLEIIK